MGCQFIGELGQGNITYLSLLRLEKTKILKMLKLRLHYKEPLENKYVLTWTQDREELRSCVSKGWIDFLRDCLTTHKWSYSYTVQSSISADSKHFKFNSELPSIYYICVRFRTLNFYLLLTYKEKWTLIILFHFCFRSYTVISEQTNEKVSILCAVQTEDSFSSYSVNIFQTCTCVLKTNESNNSVRKVN